MAPMTTIWHLIGSNAVTIISFISANTCGIFESLTNLIKTMRIVCIYACLQVNISPFIMLQSFQFKQFCIFIIWDA